MYEVGTEIKWETFGGDKYEGIITEIDSNLYIVECSDEKTRAVESGE